FGDRCMRYCHDEKIGSWQKLVEFFRGVKLLYSLRQMGAPSINADNAHAKRMTQTSGFAADAADAEDQGGSLREVHDASVQGPGQILAAHLLGHVVVKPSRKREHERHDVCADVIIVDFAEVSHHHRMRDKLGIVETGWRGGLRGL